MDLEAIRDRCEEIVRYAMPAGFFDAHEESRIAVDAIFAVIRRTLDATPSPSVAALEEKEASEAMDSFLALESDLRYLLEETGGLRHSSPLNVVEAHLTIVRAALRGTGGGAS